MKINRIDSNKNRVIIEGSPEEIQTAILHYKRLIDHTLKESRGIIDPKTYNQLVGRKGKVTEIITIIEGIIKDGKS